MYKQIFLLHLIFLSFTSQSYSKSYKGHHRKSTSVDFNGFKPNVAFRGWDYLYFHRPKVLNRDFPQTGLSEFYEEFKCRRSSNCHDYYFSPRVSYVNKSIKEDTFRYNFGGQTLNLPYFIRNVHNPKGIVFLLHGTGGSKNILKKVTAHYFANRLMAEGFSVVSFSALARIAKDLGQNSKNGVQWDVSLDKRNKDHQQFTSLVNHLTRKGYIERNTPKISIGMSNGGNFSLSLGTAKLVDNAIAYCVQGKEAYEKISVPGALFLCPEDSIIDNEKAIKFAKNVKKKNKNFLYTKGRKIPLTINSLAKIFNSQGKQMPRRDANMLIEDFKNPSRLNYCRPLIDSKGNIIASKNYFVSLLKKRRKLYSCFPSIRKVGSSFKKEILNQIIISFGGHNFYDHLAGTNIKFIKKTLRIK